MKIVFNTTVIALFLSVILQSCSSEMPFANGVEGLLKLKMVVNSDVTRADVDEDNLADKCVVYISDSGGLIHKFVGISNLPDDLWLKEGLYVAEAWTGDSVPASFTKKFYRAYEPFTIHKGVNNVMLNCKIANVVASVNPDAVIEDAFSDYVVTISNTSGSLEFTPENIASAHGYFMMPDDDNNLNWSISATAVDGAVVEKSGIIENVRSAHEYVLNIHCPIVDSEIGGAFIEITIDDKELIVEDTIRIFGAPKIDGIGFNMDSPVSSPSGAFDQKSLYIRANTAFESIRVETVDFTALQLPSQSFDLLKDNAEDLELIRNAGIDFEFAEDVSLDLAACRLSFKGSMLNRLQDGEYSLNIIVTDIRGKTCQKTLVINVSDASVILSESDWSEIYARRATLHGVVVKGGVTGAGIRYRKTGDAEWTEIKLQELKDEGQSFSVYIDGLTPGCRYEYQAIADNFVNTLSKYFNTEALYSIPNAGFEYWNTASDNAIIPTSASAADFWDTGNHGSITLGKNVTEKATSPVRSGNSSAKLSSQFVGFGSIGKFAAGNIFAGRYVRTDGMDGVLSFGQEYNESRPDKLSVWVTYISGTVDKPQSTAPEIPKDSKDKGQIYVALVTEEVEIRTKSSNRTLFDPDAGYVVAYGQYTFDDNFGSLSQMSNIEIPIKYIRSGVKPKYIVIVASASKYGDYFAGSTESVMYLDDMELIYE